MTEPKSRLQTGSRWTTSHPLLGAELRVDDFTQQVETPFASEGAYEDEPTLVGLDFEEIARAS